MGPPFPLWVSCVLRPGGRGVWSRHGLWGTAALVGSMELLWPGACLGSRSGLKSDLSGEVEDLDSAAEGALGGHAPVWFLMQESVWGFPLSLAPA